jgi:hypothetical protein
MPYNPDIHHRRSTRLKGYDYAAEGLYFITLCTAQRQCLFGAIVDGQMQLNPVGQIVAHEWMKTPQIRPNFDLDAWVVMPNHIHGIVIIFGITGQEQCSNCEQILPFCKAGQVTLISPTSFFLSPIDLG